MKTIKLKSLLLLALFTIVTIGANATKEKTDTQTRPVDQFEKISVSSGIDLYLTQGNTASVEVEADPDIIDKIITRVENGTLKIYIKEKQNWDWGWNQSRKVRVSFTEISAISASAGSDVYAEEPIELKELTIDASSGADISIDDLTADFVSIRSSSGSDAKVAGKTIRMEADSSSGSDLDCSDLVSEECEVSASSGSDALVNVSRSLKARASSGGDVRYKGNPSQKDIDESSGGDVKSF